MKINTKKYSPIFAIEDNHVLCSKGDFALGYKIKYPEKYSLCASDYETITSDWERSIKLLPVGSILVKTDIFLKEEFDSTPLSGKSFLQQAAAKHFRGRKYINHYAYLFFISPKSNTLHNDNIKNPFVIPNIKEINKAQQRQTDFINNVEDMVNMISKSDYITFEPLSEKEIEDYSVFYFNGFQTDYLTDLEIKSSHIEANNNHIGIYGITNERYFPDAVDTAVKDTAFSSTLDNFTFYQGFMDNISLNFKYNHIYNQIIFIDDHKVHETILQKNYDSLKGAARFNPQNTVWAEKLGNYIKENAQKEGFKYVRGHSNIIFWSEQAEEFETIKKKISSELKNIGFRPYYATKTQLKNLFLNSFYTNISCIDNDSLYLTELAVCCSLFNNSGNYKNDKKGIFFNERTYNIPVCYDLWDYEKKYITSRNFMVVATTGRGKSFTCNKIFSQTINDGFIHIIIDLGDSFIKMAKLFPPKDVEIFKYKDNEPLGLNPFVLTENEKLDTDKIEYLCAFVWSLTKRDKAPTELENTSMRKLITYYYEINQDIEYSWENFYSFIEINRDSILSQVGIEDEEYFNVKDFLHAGSDFVKDGIYANILQSHDNASNFIGKKLIIFELDNIKNNKLLLSIMLQVIGEAINRTIWNNKENKGIVFFDEFAKQLEFPEILRSVKFYSQAIRKQNGALGLVLQTLNQLPECPESKTILDNNETFYILQADDHRETINRLGWNEHDKVQLYSMKSKFYGKEKYSEIYIYRKKRRNVFRIEVSHEEFLAFQTEGDIHSKLMKLYEKQNSMEKAIQEYMYWENLEEEAQNRNYVSYSPNFLVRGKYGKILIEDKDTEYVLLSDRFLDEIKSEGHFYRLNKQSIENGQFNIQTGVQSEDCRIIEIETGISDKEAINRYENFLNSIKAVNSSSM